MGDFIPVPTFIREANGLAVEAVGDRYRVGGMPATSVSDASDLINNPKHYMAKIVAPIMPKLVSGEIVQVIRAEIAGKGAFIAITADQFALGAEERARYAAWLVGVRSAEKARQAAEREYDLANNEGGEGYNPHRVGDERTYSRNRNIDRDFSVGA